MQNASPRDSLVVPNKAMGGARREGYGISLSSFAENTLAGTKP
jgi:hypothetical protein